MLIALVPGLALAQNVTSVGITNGVPTSGTGTVSTLDGLAGTAGSANSKVLSVQGIASGTNLPVTGTVTATQSGTWNINNVSGTVSLPTGAATAANQTTGNSSLATIATNSSSPIPDCAATPCTNKIGITYDQSVYPVGATPITASTTGSTASITATLAGTSGKTTFICGFSIRSIATSATSGFGAVSGLISGAMNFLQWIGPASTAVGVTEPSLGKCIPASAANTSIVVTTAAPGSGGQQSVAAWGYQQ